MGRDTPAVWPVTGSPPLAFAARLETMGEVTTIELTEERRSEWGPDWTLATAFFGTVASLYVAIGYVVYLALT